MGHTHKQLTEAELIAEIQAIQGGAVSKFEGEPVIAIDEAGEIHALIEQPKRKPGRPRGSKNRPKGS